MAGAEWVKGREGVREHREGMGRLSGALGTEGRTWAFSEVGALEGCGLVRT